MTVNFNKKTWRDRGEAADSDPRLDAAELNRIEQGVADSASGVNTNTTAIATEAAQRAAAIATETTQRAAAIATEVTQRAAAVSTEASARAAADALLIPLTQKGAANGVASLGSDGLVPTAQLGGLISPFSASPIIRRRAFAAPMSQPPTITDTGTSAPAATTYYGASSAYFRYSNARVHNFTGGARDAVTAVKAYGDSGNFVSPSTGSQPVRVEWDANCQKLWLRFNMQVGTAGAAFRLWVDEQPHTATYSVLGSADSANHYWLVDLGAAFGRGYHRFVLEIGDSAPVEFDGVYALKTDDVYAPMAASVGTFLWMGDSEGDGTYANRRSGSPTFAGGFVHQLSYLLGIANFYGGYSLGGTGFLNVASSGSPKYRDRFATDVYPVSPDAIVLQTSANDGAGGFTYTQIHDEVVACIAAIQSNLPNCRILVCGPVDVPPQHGTSTATLFDWAKAPRDVALATSGVAYIDTTTNPAFTGTGNVTSPSGDGNSDYYGLASVSPSNGPPHPNAAGHAHLARYLVPQIATALRIATDDLYDLETTWVVV